MDIDKKYRKDRQHHRSNRWKCLLHYSPRARRNSEQPACHCLFPETCAGDGDSRALLIDHIANDGAEHRRQIGRSSTALYRYLVENKFPSGYQTICWNCSAIKEFVRRRKGLKKGADDAEE